MVGQTLGSYQIIREIGMGGMGAVYLAEHRHLGRKVAIKVLLKEFADRPDLLERFFAEARATSMIDHPGIVSVYDCETDPQGQPYIVMEYLAGETLGAYLERRGPLPSLDAITITRRIAEALAAAHAKGIVHRDLKPDNIFVLGNPPGAIKLVDFGIAKLTADYKAGQQSLTQTGALMGTPLYMSPEQCRAAGGVDHRTDIYSLGCLLFEMLTGRPPFQYQSLGELVAAHITQPPPDVRKLGPRVPDGVAQAVAHLMRKAAGDRPQSMEEVVILLRSLGAPSLVPPDAATLPPPATVSTSRTGGMRSSGLRPAPHTTMRGSTGEIAAFGNEARPAAPRRLTGMLIGGAVALAAVGVTAVVLRGGKSESPPPSAPAVFGTAPAASKTEEVRPPPPGEARPSSPQPPAVKPEAVAAVDRSASRRPATGRARGERPRPTGASRARGEASYRPPVEQGPAQVIIDSEPPGAEVCAVNDRRLIGTTSALVVLPARAKTASYYVSYPGYQLQRVVINAERDQRRFVPLVPLGPDDLESPSPCQP